MELSAGAIENTCSYVVSRCHNNNIVIFSYKYMAVPLNYPCKYTHSQVRLHVVERSTGEVLKTKYMSADTFYCLHHINAYEDNGNAAWL